MEPHWSLLAEFSLPEDNAIATELANVLDGRDLPAAFLSKIQATVAGLATVVHPSGKQANLLVRIYAPQDLPIAGPGSTWGFFQLEHAREGAQPVVELYLYCE